jgi:F-type H+-transporting ATPase subunit a
MLGESLPLKELVHDPAITGIQLPLGLGTVGDIHADTIILSWVAMAAILLGCAAISSNLKVDRPGGAGQAVLESLYTFILDIARGSIGEHRYRPYMPLLCGLFMFILASNLIGILPYQVLEHMPWWPHVHGKHFEVAAATTDFNVTAGLAALAIITYLGSGVMVHGHHYVGLFLWKPIAPLEWLDLVVRPATLALRLLLVITADEMLRSAFLGMCPVILPSLVMAFEVFIALVQAFVFTLLTSIYIGAAVAEHH